jgi:hypothetical protein
MQAFSEHPKAGAVCMSIWVEDPEGLVAPHISRPDLNLLHRRMTAHLPGTFFRRETLADRQFDRSVEVANDYELFVYLLREKKTSMIVVDDVGVTFSLGGRTNDPKTDLWKAQDCFRVRRKFYGFWAAWPLFIYDLGVAVLRKLGFRPRRWIRQLRYRKV